MGSECYCMHCEEYVEEIEILSEETGEFHFVWNELERGMPVPLCFGPFVYTPPPGELTEEEWNDIFSRETEVT